MKKRLEGLALEKMACPYCHSPLFYRDNFLICKVHKRGYPVEKNPWMIDFRKESYVAIDLKKYFNSER